MASIKDALVAELKADAGVLALVGSRVYQLLAPPSASFPYITIQRITDEHVHHMGGASGLVRTMFDINCWHSDAGALETLADAVRSALDTFSGTMGNGDNTATVKDCKLDSQLDLSVPPSDASPAGPYRIVMSFFMWHTETQPSP